MSAWARCGWSGYRSAWLETLLRVRDGGFRRPSFTPRSDGGRPLSQPNWAPTSTRTAKASRPDSRAFNRCTREAEEDAEWGGAAGSAFAPEQAAQHPAHDLPADPAGDAASRGLGHGLHQAVVLAAAWTRAAEQGLIQHATDAAAPRRFGSLFRHARNARGFGHAGRLGLRGGGARVHMGTQDFVGAFAVHFFFVHPGHQRTLQQALALLGRDWAELAARGQHVHALGFARAALGIQQPHQGLTH